jgi:hypothetical protein
VDTSINGAFFLGGNNYGQTSQVITAADPTHFITTGSVELDNLPGDSFDLVRWGGNGLAFRMATDFWGNGSPLVVLLSGSFVLPPSPVPNPVPAPVSLSPSSAVSPGNTWVTTNGSNFVPGSVALWNGSQRTTVFVNSGQLQVAIAAADLVKAGTAKIKVVNPTPGGGTSKALSFTIQ